MTAVRTVTRLMPRSRFSRRSGTAGEDGFGLPELLVAMLIFAILLAVIAKTILSMTTSLNKTQSLAAAADQNRSAFDHLEQQLRSATDVNRPVVVADTVSGHTGNEMYLEFQDLDINANPTCHQWRYVSYTHTLEERHWAASASAPSSGNGYTTVATGVYNTIPSGDYTTGSQSIFYFTAQGSSFPTSGPYAGPLAGQMSQFEAITFTIVTQRGTHPPAQAITQSTVLALNTAENTMTGASVQTNADNNHDNISDTQVCMGART